MKSELLFIAKMAVSFCQAFLATHGKSILDLPSTTPSDKFSFIIILMHKGCFDVDGLIPRAEKTLAKSQYHYQHQTKRDAAATARPKHRADMPIYRPSHQLTEMRMGGLFDLNPFHGSAPEPREILSAMRGEKAHNDDKKNIRVVSPKIEK